MVSEFYTYIFIMYLLISNIHTQSVKSIEEKVERANNGDKKTVVRRKTRKNLVAVKKDVTYTHKYLFENTRRQKTQ